MAYEDEEEDVAEDRVQNDAPKDDRAPEARQGQPQYKSPVVQALPQQLREPFERVILAGMKVLYSPQTQDLVRQELGKPGEPWRVVAEGVAKLMMLLEQQAKPAIPPSLIIPAAIELVYEVGTFLSEAGKEVSDQDMRTAAGYVAIIMAKSHGAKDEQLGAMFQQGGAPGAQPGAPPAGAPAPAQPRGGLING